MYPNEWKERRKLVFKEKLNWSVNFAECNWKKSEILYLSMHKTL